MVWSDMASIISATAQTVSCENNHQTKNSKATYLSDLTLEAGQTLCLSISDVISYKEGKEWGDRYQHITAAARLYHQWLSETRRATRLCSSADRFGACCWNCQRPNFPDFWVCSGSQSPLCSWWGRAGGQVWSAREWMSPSPAALLQWWTRVFGPAVKGKQSLWSGLGCNN